ncbi:MAG: pseudouridine synthase [Rubritepida sp.]|nr:pseudouridine synthase [Rubritepida sp.]
MLITTLTVEPAETDTRLDRWLKRRYPALTQGALQKMLRTGQIRVDGKRADANTRLTTGQELRIPPMPTKQAPKAEPKPMAEALVEELRSWVLHVDNDVIVINKPPGLAVQGGSGITKHLDGMLDGLAYDGERPRLVHRLDRDTSGVLVLARNVSAASHLARAFRGRDMEKTYWAVVVGEPEHAMGRISMPLSREGGSRGERTVPAAPGEIGLRSVTDYKTLEVAKRRAAFLELHPQTGRTHQLRVHCASALNCPILGDGKYGGEAAHLEGLSGSLHLHARALRLPHPEGGWLDVTAPPPPHFEETMRFFDFDNPAPRTPRRTK